MVGVALGDFHYHFGSLSHELPHTNENAHCNVALAKAALASPQERVDRTISRAKLSMDSGAGTPEAETPTTTWFPDQHEVADIERQCEEELAQAQRTPPPSPPPNIGAWTSLRLGTFNNRLNQRLEERAQWKHRRMFSRYDHALPTKEVLDLANQVFGFDGWLHRVASSTPLDIEVEKRENQEDLFVARIQVNVEVWFYDGTAMMVEGFGVGRSTHKGVAIATSRHSAMSDAIKSAFLSLQDEATFADMYIAEDHRLEAEESIDTSYDHAGFITSI